MLTPEQMNEAITVTDVLIMSHDPFAFRVVASNGRDIDVDFSSERGFQLARCLFLMMDFPDGYVPRDTDEMIGRPLGWSAP